MTFADHMNKLGVSIPQKKNRDTPLWDGPESNTEMGGITFSMLNKFLQCRERFRLYVVEGLKADDRFNHRIEYGNMWHVCEESYASENDWRLSLKDYVYKLTNRYKFEQEQILHWYNVCKIQFPVYVKHWEEHPDVRHKQNLLWEEKFCIPYTLPSGRVVYLKGKWDSVDLVTSQNNKGVWLQENKTKGDIRPELLRRQLTYDLQTMLYLITIKVWSEPNELVKPNNIYAAVKEPIKGVRYNVVRRPLAGGKHTIKPHKARGKKPAETMQEYYIRLRGLIQDNPDHFFIRFNVEVKPEDIERFKRECFNPILEQLCDWWDHIVYRKKFNGPYSVRPEPFPFINSQDVEGNPLACPHYRMPFGIRMLEDSMTTDLDNYMDDGNDIGLQRVDTLFPELV